MNNMFRIEQTTDGVRPNIFRVFKVKEKVRLMFCTPKESMKSKYNVFSGSRETNVFRSEQRTNKVPTNVFRNFEVRRNIRVMY